tara:strand:- start:2395 stop:4926 length:2532 start_codon:yes stop_codon:yes gene_type:complete
MANTNTEKIVVQVVVQGEKDLQRLEKRTGTTTRSFGKMAAGVLGAVAAFRQVTSAVSNAIRSFRDFEFQMAKVKAITGANRTEFLKLTKSAQDLGRSTFFTAQQVAELQTNYGKLGFTTKEILNAQEATLQLATATDSDLARSAIVAGSAVRGFGLDASETQRVVDVMAVAFTSSALDIEKFQTSMTKVAPIAKSAGFSIEDTTAIMSQLADSGIEASIAGTSLRNILLKMQDPNSDLVKSFGKTIHSLDELVPALTKFSKEGGSLAEIMEVVDLRQAAAFEQMITSRERTVELRDALKDANGAAEEMARIVGDTLEGALKRSESATQGLAIAFIDSFGKTFQNIVDGFASFVNVLTDFIEIPISEKLAEDKHEMNLLFEVLKDTNNSQETRNKAMIKLNLEYGSYLPNLVTEKNTVKELSEHQENANKQLAQRILMMGAQERLNEIQKEGQKIGQEIFDETVKLRDLEEDMGTNREKFVMGDMGVQTSLTGQAIMTSTSNLRKLNKELEKHKEAQADAIKVAKEFGVDVEGNTKVQENETNVIVKNTEATKANTQAKQEDTIFTKIQESEFDQLLTLQERLLSGKITQAEFDEQNAANQIRLLDSVLRHSKLTDEERVRIQLRLNKLKIQDIQDTQSQIQGIGQLGDSLINLAGQDEKYQEVREVGIKLSAAAALANNLEALSLQGKALSRDLALGFPANLIAVASTLALLMSIKSNIAALSGGQKMADGGMVQGKSHAQGGEKFAVGGRVVELEGGEAVINKRSTAMFRSQLSAMNSAGGGVKFADGGLLNMPSFSQQQFNALGQNQMMGAMAGGNKVVVVEADITASQNAVSVIQSDATV